ncbi:hypothetical protein AG1IA_00672 [Rhizoctonia solani AG-1 IA]|uniref:Uncharacterized protein n=1 Tax=Thanatephorus cucumeris (strain AG1-IA) TaxID=983506 RepID=L8X4U3_THACA|nr:hypothetical protein AG1IA_00672 [Rhizoctonia solani AG-1 IA]
MFALMLTIRINRYAIGIVFTLISWIIAIFTICFIPDQPRSKRSIRLVSVPFAVLGCMQPGEVSAHKYSAALPDNFAHGNSSIRLMRGFLSKLQIPSLPAGTKKHVVAPFVNLPSTSSLEMVSMTPTIGSPSPSGPRIVFTDPEPRGRGGGRAAFRRPAVYGPERVVEDPRIREFHQGVIRDMLWVGFGWGLAWTGIVVGIPGRG